MKDYQLNAIKIAQLFEWIVPNMHVAFKHGNRKLKLKSKSSPTLLDSYTFLGNTMLANLTIESEKTDVQNVVAITLKFGKYSLLYLPNSKNDIVTANDYTNKYAIHFKGDIRDLLKEIFPNETQKIDSLVAGITTSNAIR